MADTTILRKIHSAKSERLKDLDLSYDRRSPPSGKLTQLPSELFQLDHLEDLNLSGHALTGLPSALAHLANLKYLDVSRNDLRVVPSIVGELHALTTLDLSENQLTALPDTLSSLSNLTNLDISTNHFLELPTVVFRLTNLLHLDARNSRIITISPDIAALRNLTSLYISRNHLTAFPPPILLLSTLRLLDLAYNRIDALPDALQQLQLTDLRIGHSKYPAPPEVVFHVRPLTSLDLSGSRLSKLSDSISRLRNLTHLDLSDNLLSTLPSSIARLQELKYLMLWDNRFTTIPEPIYQLRSLRLLDFDNIAAPGNDNRIKTISPKILALDKLVTLNLRENPVESPPPEVTAAGVAAIKNYFMALQAEGVDYLYEAKLLLVGEGGAGKTTLAKKLQDPNYQLRDDETSTEGIETSRWTFTTNTGQDFRINTWDFGGQEIYHATHQFFLTKRSLYVLVADTRKEDTDFYYWLNVVDLLSEHSPLLIVKNEKQDRHREINDRLLRSQFDSFKDSLAVNLATNRGLDTLVAEVIHYISQLPHVGTPLPRSWVNVRKALEEDSRNYIRLEDYLDVCERNGFLQLRDKLQLSGYLHDLGVCLHFQEEPLLSRIVILKPAWGTAAVYMVLDNPAVIRSLGRFTRAELTAIWASEQYKNMAEELLQLMMKFKLCYRVPGESDVYIAPQLLSENQPFYQWDERDNVIVRYSYEFMPKGILAQFIVVMHALIHDQRYVWKSGVLLQKDDTKAEVIEHYGKREIRIRITGKYKRDLVTIVTYELDRINDSYKSLKIDRLIPCNCEVCNGRQDPYFYPFEVLRKFLEDRELRIQCQKSYHMVQVRELVEGAGVTYGLGKEKKKGEESYAFYGSVETVVIGPAGDVVMTDNRGKEVSGQKSAWANGSFYLASFCVVVAGLGTLANVVPLWTFGLTLVAGLLFVPLIGVLQLRQDDRLSEKGFVDLLRMVIGQLPLIGRIVKRDQGPTIP